MKNYSVRQYQENDYQNWNAFIGQAKNSTFLFHRDFMGYHNVKFQDYSLIVLDKEKWVAVLPANIVGNEVFSHQGLTYGGLVYNEKIKLASVIEIFKGILSFLNENNIEKLQLKLIPSIYHQKPAEEINYVLFLAKAQLIRRDSMAVIDLSKKNILSKLRKRSVQKGVSNDFKIKEVEDFKLFWNDVLIPNLALRHQAKPVHSLEEIAKLKTLFPNNIRQFNVYENGIINAGTTIFETDNVVHCQYISGKEAKNELGGLDLLFHHLITEVFKNKHFFDFGISNENQGRKLNNGLSYWKESFGASVIVHDFYEVKSINHNLLDNVLL
ncbi:GNAT family N-acetyltransferase [Flavobacterium soyangense]|uniref:GNAT family N-acetyltransferase n=1 Tax=Flavobacterium soyangense TaxID=2023265 RepID=A0A930Y0E2_9FLAO|nr:GNAT family N-acetyltransferase [Flavobacterium soyangense]MBF2708379.1 GNAT family N-acetyltransferase [Flavobacterium soyangense]